MTKPKKKKAPAKKGAKKTAPKKKAPAKKKTTAPKKKTTAPKKKTAAKKGGTKKKTTSKMNGKTASKKGGKKGGKSKATYKKYEPPTPGVVQIMENALEGVADLLESTSKALKQSLRVSKRVKVDFQRGKGLLKRTQEKIDKAKKTTTD